MDYFEPFQQLWTSMTHLQFPGDTFGNILCIHWLSTESYRGTYNIWFSKGNYFYRLMAQYPKALKFVSHLSICSPHLANTSSVTSQKNYCRFNENAVSFSSTDNIPLVHILCVCRVISYWLGFSPGHRYTIYGRLKKCGQTCWDDATYKDTLLLTMRKSSNNCEPLMYRLVPL